MMFEDPVGEPPVTRDRGMIWVWIVVLGLWVWFTVPLALGTRTLVARDVFSIHLHLKWFGAEELSHGRIPAFNPTWDLGQPFRGNPNAVAWYPGNLLYLVLPFWSAFNLHYALHWLLALLGMRALAARLGQSSAGALAAGLAYACSGYLFSALMYYNVLPVVAWWPFALWGVARGDRRGLVLGGVACGMVLLGGEPVTAALGVVPLVLVAWRGRWLEALWRSAAVGALGLAIALPQVVSTWRVLPFSHRFVAGLTPTSEELSRLPVWRLIELVLPMPYGHPFLSGPAGFVGYDFLPHLPLLITLHFGIIALVLAALASPHRLRWASLTAMGVAVPFALTFWPRSVEHLTGGLARYPEKFVLWFALGAALLAGWGLERLLSEPARGIRILRRLALVLAIAGGAVFLTGSQWVRWIAVHAPQAPDRVAPAQIGMWLFFLLFAVLALALAAWAVARRSAAGVLLTQVLSVLPLGVLLPTDSTEPYRVPAPWVRALPPGAAVFNGSFLTALGEAQTDYRLSDGRMSSLRRLAALDLLPGPGVLHGLRYPLAPDFDGMISWPVARVLGYFPKLSWEQRAQWLRAFGVDAVVLPTAESPPGLRALETVDRAGVPTTLAAVDGRAPAVWWPSELVAADSSQEAVRSVLALKDILRTAVVLGVAPPQDPDGSARLVEAGADRMVLETRGGGGIVAITRAFQPQFRAVAEDGRPLPIRQLDLALLGVAVPAGEHRVVVEVSNTPELAAALLGLMTLLGALGVAALKPVSRTVAPDIPR